MCGGSSNLPLLLFVTENSPVGHLRQIHHNMGWRMHTQQHRSMLVWQYVDASPQRILAA